VSCHRRRRPTAPRHLHLVDSDEADDSPDSVRPQHRRDAPESSDNPADDPDDDPIGSPLMW
jgi:hypothetical protein